MKRFVFNVACFLLPIVVVAFLMEVLLRFVPNGYLLKKKFLDENSSRIEVLILGSSHSLYGLDPAFFTDNTFNASHVSQSLDYDFRIFKKYRDNFSGLRALVLPVSYFSLFEKLEDGPESWRVKSYIRYYDLSSSESIRDHSEVLGNRANVSVMRLVSYYLLGNSTLSCSPLGWGTDYNAANARDLVVTGKAAAKRHTRDEANPRRYREIYDESVAVLDSILSWCEDRSIKVILFTPPAFATYRENLKKEQLNETVTTVSELCSRHGNCTYENRLEDTSFVSADFYDADHLSEIGAEKLSKSMDEKIRKWKQGAIDSSW